MFNTQDGMDQGGAEEVRTQSHALDQPTVLQGEEDIPVYLDEVDTKVPTQTQAATDTTGADDDKGGSADDGSQKLNAFEEEEQKAADEGAKLKDDELVEKLKAMGYDVSKKDTPNEDQVFTDTMKMYDDSIAQSTSFINLPDDKIVEEKVKYDLMGKYRSTGREHLINTEEFNIEAEAEMDTYESNDALKKIYADNIRRDVKDGVLSKTTSAKQKLVDEQTKKIDQDITKRKTELRNSFNDIYSQGLLGMKFEKEDIQKAFDYISTGEFSKEIKNDPNSLAELALYRLHRDKIVSKIGGPTYGEGVRDAVKELQGDKNKNTSHISNAMQTNAGKGQEGVIKRDWSSVLDPNSDEAKGKMII